jgi:hypothetical protein
MWNDTTSIIRSQLGPGEALLWSGQPRKGIVFRLSDAAMIPFSLLWGGFAIFWEVAVITSGAPFMTIWGIPFVVIGLHMIFGRFFLDAKQRDKTYYGVTNERAIIVSGLFSKKVTSLNLRTISNISLEQKSDGSGTITFGPANSRPWWNTSASWPLSRQPIEPGFEMIQDAKKVDEIIRRAQRGVTSH